MKKLYDVIGVGFGPANIALAIAAQELHPGLDIHFIESRNNTQWQPDMMLPGADIQNNPLRDLVTPRNPKSHYTFVNFLKETNRLFDHLNLGLSFPLRIEYNQYVQWVAEHFKSQVSYGQNVTRIELSKDNKSKGYQVETGCGEIYYAKSIVLAPGRTPFIPNVLAKTNSDRVIHYNKLLTTLNSIDSKDNTRESFAIVGGSQSAVEIGLYLRKRFPEAKIDNIIRNFGFRQKDLSPFTGEVYYPEYAEYYFNSSVDTKKELDKDLRYTNYSSADSDVIDELYLSMYQDKICGEERHRLLRNSLIVDSEEISDKKIKISLKNKFEGTITNHEYDYVISATGFRDIGTDVNQEKKPPILSTLVDHLQLDENDCLIIGRDYQLSMKEHINPDSPVMLNGLCEKSHGMGDAGSFSLLSLRSEQIINHVNSCLSVKKISSKAI